MTAPTYAYTIDGIEADRAAAIATLATIDPDTAERSLSAMERGTLGRTTILPDGRKVAVSVAPVADTLPALVAVSDKQRAYGADCRAEAVREMVAQVSTALARSLAGKGSADAAIAEAREAIIAAAAAVPSAKAWIEQRGSALRSPALKTALAEIGKRHGA